MPNPQKSRKAKKSKEIQRNPQKSIESRRNLQKSTEFLSDSLSQFFNVPLIPEGQTCGRILHSETKPRPNTDPQGAPGALETFIRQQIQFSTIPGAPQVLLRDPQSLNPQLFDVSLIRTSIIRFFRYPGVNCWICPWSGCRNHAFFNNQASDSRMFQWSGSELMHFSMIRHRTRVFFKNQASDSRMFQ